jgi:hypothetical protein
MQISGSKNGHYPVCGGCSYSFDDKGVGVSVNIDVLTPCRTDKKR